MNQPRIAVLGMLASVLVAATALTPTARADTPAPAAQPTKIGVIDLVSAYKKLDETESNNTQLKGMRDELTTMTKSHQAQLEDYQNKMSHVAPGSDQHTKMMDEFDKMGLQFKMEETAQQARMVRQQGRQMAQAFAKIQTAVTSVAKSRGLDIVLVKNGQELPENVGDISNQETLQNLIFNRSILYVSPNVDITDTVVASVNAADKAPAAPAGH
jgi:Skp family chaperone for outer membrane proteins